MPTLEAEIVFNQDERRTEITLGGETQHFQIITADEQAQEQMLEMLNWVVVTILNKTQMNDDVNSRLDSAEARIRAIEEIVGSSERSTE